MYCCIYVFILLYLCPGNETHNNNDTNYWSFWDYIHVLNVKCFRNVVHLDFGYIFPTDLAPNGIQFGGNISVSS